MNKQYLLAYNLSKISDIDKEMTTNNENRKMYLKKNHKKITLYKLLNGDQAIMRNIKLKIHKQQFYEYDKYLDKVWLHQDEYALKTLKEMQNKEYIFTQSIKNKVYFELNYQPGTEKLSVTELKTIINAL